MERQIQFHSLLKDELVYEVQIRSETPATTVEGLRKQLRGLIVEAPSEVILDTPFSAETDLNVISEKLSELSSLVDRHTRHKDRYTASRTRALAHHLFYRLGRIKPELSAEHLAIKAASQSRLEALLVKVDSFNPGSAVSGVTPEAMTSDFRDLQLQCSSDLSISKWGVKFNGSTDPRSFLERVEELREANNVPSSKLFRAAPHLFVDQALIWYRGIKESVNNWNDLKHLLLDEFEPCDYDHRLKLEIQSRTQGENEQIHLYFATMSGLFGRLRTALSEEAKLEILLHNIRPIFTQQLALLEINTVAELKSNCRKLEGAMQRVKLFTEPPKVTSSTLCSEYAFKGKSSSVNAVAVNGNAAYNAPNPKPDTSSSRRTNNFTSAGRGNHYSAPGTSGSSGSIPVCYKCGGIAHNFRFCKRAKQHIKPNNGPNCQSDATDKCKSCAQQGSVQKPNTHNSKN